MVAYKIIISILLVSQIAVADDAIFLDVNKPAPFAGFLLSKEKVISLRNNDIDLTFLKKENDNLKIEVTDYQARLDNYKTENKDLAERLQKSNTSFFERTGFFILGAILTGSIAYGLYKVK